MCSIVRSFSRRVWPRVRCFLSVLGQALLEIGSSITLCLCFGSLMNRMMRSTHCRDCRCDGGNSLLTVATG